MKYSEVWLREWVNPPLTKEQLCSSLTMAGLEVEEITPLPQFTNVVVGQVLNVTKHPEADRLHVCQVDTGKNKTQIICGAKNVRTGMKVAVALVNAKLPDNKIIKKTKIRNIESNGMLCSANELGLFDESEGILDLSYDTPLGMDLKSLLKLDDYIIDIAITPNRGDCLSVKGISREISALTQAPLLKNPAEVFVEPENNLSLSVDVENKKDCPVYMGRIIRGVKADAETPIWIKEYLRRSGVRCISLIVDVTNFVMLELGQPMHAFDLAKINNGIKVRMARDDEIISLLDGSQKILNAETLIIADTEKPLAIAGVMGGIDSSVTLLTQDIFLESAFFVPETVAKQRQFHELQSESAYRFERGVDPTIQREALERATQLILKYAGGSPGLVVAVVDKESLPSTKVITLSAKKIFTVLGVSIAIEKIDAILKALQFPFHREDNYWHISVPSWRFFDIALPEDVIEEVARLYGYNHIPKSIPSSNLQIAPKDKHDFSEIRKSLRDNGYCEIISYSFVDHKLQKILDPEQGTIELVNPITADMTVMRTNLWPGLINAWIYNKNRQQSQIRLFEIGTCFTEQKNKLHQLPRLAGLISGFALPEQWGHASRKVDFFDLTGNLDQLGQKQFVFESSTHKALHPGQTAVISNNKGERIGICGLLHPAILQKLDINEEIFVFEIDILDVNENKSVLFQEISKFPEIRRDLAIIVNEAVPAKAIQDRIREIAGDWLKDVFIFDVYQGPGILPDHKSVALGLILQHPSRTLVDEEVSDLIADIVSALKEKLGAVLRS